MLVTLTSLYKTCKTIMGVELWVLLIKKLLVAKPVHQVIQNVDTLRKCTRTDRKCLKIHYFYKKERTEKDWKLRGKREIEIEKQKENRKKNFKLTVYDAQWRQERTQIIMRVSFHNVHLKFETNLIIIILLDSSWSDTKVFKIS